jgi:hypothetical protein
MKEDEKLREAKYFYSRMIEEQENRDAFKFNLSAFLSSARSVLQYALKEARRKTGGQQWYDNWMDSSCVLSFLGKKRNFNTHTAPIEPRTDVTITVHDMVHISDSVHIELKDKEGKVLETQDIQEKAQPREETIPPVTSESRHKFQDWSGNEDVIELCGKYIQELEKVILDGLNKGYITK